MAGNAPYVFQIVKNDIGTVMVDLLRLQWTAACPFAGSLGAYAQGTGTATADLQEIAGDETCCKALSVLAAPSHGTIYNTGGGMNAVSYLNIYTNASIAGGAVVSITPSFNDSILIQYFDSPESFALWFADTVTFAGEEATASSLPASFSVESLVHVLHTVDCYRRATYMNLLEFKTGDDLFISSAEYANLLNASVNSRDMRWLLPAFAMLTPNLARYGIQLSLESMKIVLDAKLLVPVRMSASGEEFYKFDEAGRKLGASFYASWLIGIGFESMTFDMSGNVGYIDNGFIAPTASGNHLFLLSKGANGKGLVNYSNLPIDGFVKKIAALVSAPAFNKSQSSGNFKCHSCGNELSTGTKFCKNCGAKQ